MPDRPVNRHHAQAGLSLIELLMFVVVVSIALAALLKVFVQATTASADPQLRRQALAIAESLLREVQLMPVTFCDPDDANVGTATVAAVGAGTSNCASLAEASGPESGETRYGPTYFDNVNDYAAFSMTGIRDITNKAVSGLSGYNAQVTISSAALGSITAGSGDAMLITVLVTAPDGNTLSLQGWRTRYAPNAAF
jgi:MSHA pilin protein MshD